MPLELQNKFLCISVILQQPDLCAQKSFWATSYSFQSLELNLAIVIYESSDELLENICTCEKITQTPFRKNTAGVLSWICKIFGYTWKSTLTLSLDDLNEWMKREVMSEPLTTYVKTNERQHCDDNSLKVCSPRQMRNTCNKAHEQSFRSSAELQSRGGNTGVFLPFF